MLVDDIRIAVSAYTASKRVDTGRNRQIVVVKSTEAVVLFRGKYAESSRASVVDGDEVVIFAALKTPKNWLTFYREVRVSAVSPQ